MPRHSNALITSLAVALASQLMGCGDESAQSASASGPAAAAPGPPVVVAFPHGVFVGTMKADGITHSADAIITEDGLMRLRVGAGGDIANRPMQSSHAYAQFVGTVNVSGISASGSGVFVPERCEVTATSYFCGEPVAGELRMTIVDGNPVGQITFGSLPAERVWALELTALNTFYSQRATPLPYGLYFEVRAAFAGDADTFINIDEAGALFFQSPGTGCVGNGRMRAHANGEYAVYDLQLDIQTCKASRDYLNGSYEGLVSPAPEWPGINSFNLRGWLSKRDAATAPLSLSMLAGPPNPWAY